MCHLPCRAFKYCVRSRRPAKPVNGMPYQDIGVRANDGYRYADRMQFIVVWRQKALSFRFVDRTPILPGVIVYIDPVAERNLIAVGAR
ncbi:MAG: hypothetical protein V1799_04600 [bacterium]